MKKIGFTLLTVVAAMLASCGNKNVESSETNSSTSETTEEHIHAYDVKGQCSCGHNVGKTLSFNEAFGTDYIEFEAVEKTVYFNFDTICNSEFYVDDAYYAVPSTTADEDFKPAFSSIKLYKEGELNVNVLDTNELDIDFDDDGDEKYYFYQSTDNLERNTKYYCVITFAEEQEEYKVYIDTVYPHNGNVASWEDNSDHTKRHGSYECEECGEECEVEETYIYDIKLPLFQFESGVSLAENFVNISKTELFDGGVVIRPYGCNGCSNSDIADSSTMYFMNFYLYISGDYCFANSLVVRDYQMSMVTPTSSGSYTFQATIQVGCK